jgi:hypothetical protein
VIAPAALAFGPIYLAGAAFLVGIAILVALGRPPGARETPCENERRGRAPKTPALQELEASVERKAEFLVHMGFTEIEWIADDPTPQTTVFRVRNPMPMAGGTYLVHFIAARGKQVVESPRVREFRSVVKHEEGVLKGILVTSGAFTEQAFAALENAPIELIDGKQLDSLLRMFYPERFPRERL